MNALRKLSQNLSTLNLVEQIETLMQEDKQLLTVLQRDQLWAGQKADGMLITPSYENDTEYFHSVAAAQRYSAWKDSLSQRKHNPIFAERPSGTPNLIITGRWLYDALVIDIGGGKLSINVNSPIGGKLEAKYGEALLGLNHTALEYYVEEILFPRLQRNCYEWLNKS